VVAGDGAVPALKSFVGVSQILFGSDYPFGDPAQVARGMEHCGFTVEELRAIDRDNALKLLPKWK